MKQLLSFGGVAIFPVAVDNVADLFLFIADKIADPVLLLCRLAFEGGPDPYDFVIEHAVAINSK